MFFRQQEFDVRCEWGERGLAELVPVSDAVAIVDVLSFSTSVEIAASRGAIVYPYRWKDETAARYAESVGAVLAAFDRESNEGFSLSPASLLNIPAGTRLVLPSPNGSTLTLTASRVETFAGSLRNAAAVADALGNAGRRLSVIPAGERWEDGSLRFALEDLLGAGAIIAHLPGTRSPEAESAVAVFESVGNSLCSCLKSTGSGKELIERGFEKDVELAAESNVSDCVPVLSHGAYVRQKN